ncbi:cytochrome P450 6k1-like [Aricia agestis]|uniref:cytochrome P450 6k1-like n=1 Tax=Aricia agestis TaxID=91739 RepID=UPI001C20333C|nr:cytochrome P450 6k1-like [Aricia agestis]
MTDLDLKTTMLSVLPIFFALFYIYCRYRLSYWRRRGVREVPNANLLFGHFKNGFLFRTAPGYHLGEVYKQAPKDAPVAGFYIFHKPCLLLKDPKIIKQILIRDFDNFTDRHFGGPWQKDSVGMKNLFGLKNPAWKYLRSKVSPLLTKTKLKQILPFMMETGQPMMEYLDKEVKDNGKVVDVQDVNYIYTADLIANIVLGTKTNTFKNPNSDFYKFFMDFFRGFKRMVALVIVFFMPELVKVIGNPVFVNSKYVQKLFWSTIEEREKSGVKRGDFIDSIIQLKNSEQNSLYKFEGENLMFQIGQFFSGFESSSIAVAFTLMQLAKQKPLQDRAREDIKQAIDKHGWTIEAFNEMKYIDQCVAEGVRLHPAVSTIDRYTKEDYKIPDTDIVIEKGTPIFISLYGLHNDPQFFENPTLFDPERFAEGKKVSDANIPFGIGPRMCVGMKVGQLHVKVILALILSQYELHQEPHVVTELDSRATLTAAADGINLQLRRLAESLVN